MTNRRFTRKGARGVLAAAIAAFAAGTLAPATQAANVDGPSVFWKFSSWGNPRAFTAGFEHLAKRVEEETGGKFKIRVFHGEQISKAKENLDGLKAGAFEAAAFCNFYHPGKNPALMVMTMPFLPIPDFDTAWKVRDGLYQNPILADEMAAWNALYYATTNLPQYEFMGAGDPPLAPEDFKGLRVRAGGGIGVAMEKMGAIRQSMPATEVYTALQRGTIDAESLPYTYAHASYKIHEVADWFTSNMSPGTSDCPIVFSKSAYESLPEQYQKLLQDLKPEVKDVYKEAYDAADAKNLPLFREKLKEVVYTPEQLDAFRTVAGQPVWDEWVAENKDKFDAQAVLDLVLKLAGGES
ncbi:MAG: TRAP transporter substrate-binding protein DctP [Pseudomonadota bacterium]|nr:TRAP transporter substrate-binding protein DctP [Pseudomonadota bacterium]MEE3098221.1 TRAP transporter substrate-binding protein DctP [Pseudomonadota bacterium]